MYSGNGVAKGDGVSIDFDLFGGAFFLLTRYEEVVLPARNRFDNFPATESVLAKTNALDRPLVDEYAQILKKAIDSLWPGTKFKERRFKIVPTHDVDWPYEYLFMQPKRIAQRVLGRLIARGNPTGARQAAVSWRAVRRGDDAADPYYAATVRLMDLSEKAGLQSRFYFLAGHTNPRFDTDYDIAHPRIRKLLKLIHTRRHLIGLHPSYGTLGKPELIDCEFRRLREVCAQEKIEQSEWGVRSHYLRFDPKRTFRDYDGAGFDFDSTLTFMERAGFRCGTCHEFTAFDLLSRKELRLKEQPLVAMEVSLFDRAAENLSHERAASKLAELKRQCRSVEGQFIFLWHNSRFLSEADWEVYSEQLRAA
jgi:hypothetical protein